MEKEAASVSKQQWSEYFSSIVSVCPWSKAYWAKQRIDIQTWTGEKDITPLENYAARMWIHKQASGRLLKKIHNRLNELRDDEEWLYSHPCYKGHSTPVPVLIQQNRTILERARDAL